MDKHEMQNRLKELAFSIADIAEDLPKNSLGRYLQNQIIRSAFSAAANYRAACIAQSRASFVAKLSIAFEEADETQFWLECIIKKSLVNKDKLDAIIKESNVLTRILASARKSAQNPE